MADIEQYLEKHADADGNVSDEAMARLLTGGATEGDTAAAAPAESGAPAAGTEAPTPAPAAAPEAPAPAPAPAADKLADPPAPTADKPTDPPSPAVAPAPAEPEQVILAKDGKHTIPYQKLVSAREEAKTEKARTDQAEREAVELREKLAKASTPAAAPAPTNTPAPAGEIFGDYSDEAIRKGVSTLVADAMGKFKADVTAQLEPVKKQADETAAEAHFRTIYTKHPDADSIVESAEYERWLAAHPSFVRQSYESVIKGGSAAQINELLDTYKAAHPATAPAPAPAPAPAVPAAVDPQKKADEIVANVKPKAPATLSDVPAGSQVHHDEAEAMAEMSPLDLMAKFEGKTPSQIEALMRRLV